MRTNNLTVAILAGGDSSRYGSEKATILFQDQQLITHMVQVARKLTSNIVVVLSDSEQENRLGSLLEDTKVVTDSDSKIKSALNGAITAFEFSNTEFTLLLPVDTPLANVDLLLTLYQLADGHGAVVPSWPNGNIEPLHAVYLTEHAYAKGLETLDSGRRRMQVFLDNLTNVLYLSTEVLKKFDPQLLTFENINTLNDLKRILRLVKL
jgi:molybdopterin-guanine dinucleotide biosynthesis protein A